MLGANVIYSNVSALKQIIQDQQSQKSATTIYLLCISFESKEAQSRNLGTLTGMLL